MALKLVTKHLCLLRSIGQMLARIFNFYAFVWEELCTCHRLAPGVGPRANQGNMSGNKGMNWLLCPWAGENSRHCFEFEGKGWGNSKFYKITDANHGDIREICHFPQPINTGNIKGVKRSETENTRFRAA